MSGLNKYDQRSAIHTILGRDYELYDKALAFLGREALEIRRVHLCQKFATRTIQKKTRYANWFCSMDKVPLLQIKIKGHQNRTRFKFQLVHTGTGRYEESLVNIWPKFLIVMLFNPMWIVHYSRWRLLLCMSTVSNCMLPHHLIINSFIIIILLTY